MLVDNELETKCKDLEEKKKKYYKYHWPAVILAFASAGAILSSLSLYSNGSIDEPDYYVGSGISLVIGVLLAVYAKKHSKTSEKFKLKLAEECALLAHKTYLYIEKDKDESLKHLKKLTGKLATRWALAERERLKNH